MTLVTNDAGIEATTAAPPRRLVADSVVTPATSRAKRALDIGVAATALVVLAPLFVVVALAVKLSSPGPVLFRQERVGAGGRTFGIWKFRSMRVDAEAYLFSHLDLYRRYLDNDYKLTVDEDPRVTSVGRFLRRTSLDEVPQFLNVLLGHMSLVGPRPVLAPELARYGDDVDSYLAARPGLTGSWQVAGRSAVEYADRVGLDVEYVGKWSVMRDVKILLRTPRAVLFCRGSH
jgi:exopolysaccharide production protein ExoY